VTSLRHKYCCCRTVPSTSHTKRHRRRHYEAEPRSFGHTARIRMRRRIQVGNVDRCDGQTTCTWARSAGGSVARRTSCLAHIAAASSRRHEKPCMYSYLENLNVIFNNDIIIHYSNIGNLAQLIILVFQYILKLILA